MTYVRPVDGFKSASFLLSRLDEKQQGRLFDAIRRGGRGDIFNTICRIACEIPSTLEELGGGPHPTVKVMEMLDVEIEVEESQGGWALIMPNNISSEQVLSCLQGYGFRTDAYLEDKIPTIPPCEGVRWLSKPGRCARVVLNKESGPLVMVFDREIPPLEERF